MYAIEMNDIVKKFGEFYANNGITLKVKPQSIHAILGENGAGKSTLMNILFGFYNPTSGQIRLSGKDVTIDNPLVANELGIGMVHQHFKLVPTMTVAQNIILGSEPTKGLKVDIKKANESVQAIIDKYNFQINASDKVNTLSVGQQQKVEILKMLYNDNSILIFDEPSGALTPQETEELLGVIRDLRDNGKTIIIITHKLKEIKAIADECTVIRKGTTITSFEVDGIDEDFMAEQMVGRKVNFKIDKNPINLGTTKLEVKNMTYKDSQGILKVNNVSFEVKRGEIFGLAGIDGNGQNEIIKCVVGALAHQEGKVIFDGNDISKMHVRDRNELGLAYIPQDRQEEGVVLDYNIGENAALKDYYRKPFSKMGILKPAEMKKAGQHLIDNFDVRTPHGVSSDARDLSGGNQQKLIIGRELSLGYELIIAVQPTRGVDVGAIESIHQQLLDERDKGNAIILMSLELDEVMNLSDRIAVMHDGDLMGIVDAEGATENMIGLMMAGKEISNDEK